MGRELEVYIDDIVIMAQSEEQHLLHLRKAFERMRQYKFQIHPLKCAFGVSAGKVSSSCHEMMGQRKV